MSSPTDAPRDRFSAADDVVAGVLEDEAEPTIQAPTRRQAFLGRLLVSRDLAILAVAILLFLFFTAANPRFASASNLISMAKRAPIIGIMAVGMTYLLVAGELDLSVGASMGFLMVLIATMVGQQGQDPWLSTLIIVVLGIIIGAINGLLVTRFKLRSFIATLGMLAVLRGVSNAWSGGVTTATSPKYTNLDFFTIINGNLFDTRIPVTFAIMVVVMAIGAVILARTKFGSDIYATGGNAEAARNNAINTQRVKLVCFMIMGGLCGLSGMLFYGRIQLAPSNAGVGFELQVIAICIIGGVGLFGGRGTILGTFIGMWILVMLSSGLILMGVQDYWDGFMSGVVILIAATLDLVVLRSASRLLGRAAG